MIMNKEAVKIVDREYDLDQISKHFLIIKNRRRSIYNNWLTVKFLQKFHCRS